MYTYTQSYPARRTFEKYDALHYLLYLNEEAVQYVPLSFTPGDDSEAIAAPAPVDGFSYTGTMPDGGTLIAATEAKYAEFVAGLIRLTYSADDEQALQTNMVSALADNSQIKAWLWKQEFDTYQSYRAACKKQADEVLNRNKE